VTYGDQNAELREHAEHCSAIHEAMTDNIISVEKNVTDIVEGH